MRIKHIGMLSLGVNLALFGALSGLLSGVLIALSALGALAGGGAAADSGVMAIGGLTGIWAIVSIPIAFAIFLFIGGVISALIYNLVFKLSGGLAVDIQP